jgi:hypothetical protein
MMYNLPILSTNIQFQLFFKNSYSSSFSTKKIRDSQSSMLKNSYFNYLDELHQQSIEHEKSNDQKNMNSLSEANIISTLKYLSKHSYLDFLEYNDSLKEFLYPLHIDVPPIKKRKRRWDHILKSPKPIAIFKPLNKSRNFFLIILVSGVTILFLVIVPDLNFILRRINLNKFIFSVGFIKK